MPTFQDTYSIALHSQHTLQQADLLAIYAFANHEGVDQTIESCSFDDFLGLTVYLFITTPSQDIREQLVPLLSKFGSAAVLPLLKILCKKDFLVERNIQALVKQTFSQMAPYPLAIGIGQILDRNVDNELTAAALQILKQLTCEPSTRLALSQLFSENAWKNIEDLLSENSSNSVVTDPRLSIHFPSTASRRHHQPVSDSPLLEHRVVQCV